MTTEDAELLAALVDEYGYTDVLDTMADIAQENIDEWRSQRSAWKDQRGDAVRAIVSDLTRTRDALQEAALGVRG